VERKISETVGENRLLAALPIGEIKVLARHLEKVDLKLRQQIYHRNQPVRDVWFMERGVASLVKDMEDGNVVEIATVGPEGMLGLPLFLGEPEASNHTFIQVPGAALRMDGAAFLKALKRTPGLSQLLRRYTLALLNQIAQSSACNRSHSVDQRCARWLLMTHDRVHETSFFLTQEFLAQMLGVRRQTVSVAAGMLMRQGLIDYSRGSVTVRNRRGLEKASCECYEAIARQYDLLVGARG